ncbi:hypothetical protein REPUB_Repub06bG0099000 [Reevesia pubescens]
MWKIFFWRDSRRQCFLRIRVAIEVHKPLMAGFWVPRSRKAKVWAEIKYVKLFNFYYDYGNIGHTNKGCDVDEIFKERIRDNHHFGIWMRLTHVRDNWGGKFSSDSSKNKDGRENSSNLGNKKVEGSMDEAGIEEGSTFVHLEATPLRNMMENDNRGKETGLRVLVLDPWIQWWIRMRCVLE